MLARCAPGARAGAGKGGSRRCLTNARDVWEALLRAFPSRPALLAAPSASTPYLAQVRLARRASLVIGLHGGQLGSAVWLGPGQALLEIQVYEARAPPTRAQLENERPVAHGGGTCFNCMRPPKPSLFTNMALGAGASYGSVMCHNCSFKDGGAVDSRRVVAAARALLAGLGAPSGAPAESAGGAAERPCWWSRAVSPSEGASEERLCAR